MKIIVLAGGLCPERDVSLVSGAGICRTLLEKGHDVFLMDVFMGFPYDPNRLEEVFALGIWRAIIGSAAVSDPDFVKAALEKYGPERIAVGVDAKDGLVRTAGWVKESGENYLDFAKRMEQLGVRNIIFTDIDTDGMQTGPSFARLQFLRDQLDCSVIAAGGVSCNADIQALKRMGVEAVIVGKSWYMGALDLKQAIEEGGPQ